MLRRRPKFPTNTTELFYVLQEGWMSIPDSYFTNIVRSMPTRANLVMMNRGKSIKY